MRERPLVSVAINNYNYARFLREAIDSALDQTYPHTEVVIVLKELFYSAWFVLVSLLTSLAREPTVAVRLIPARRLKGARLIHFTNRNRICTS